MRISSITVTGQSKQVTLHTFIVVLNIKRANHQQTLSHHIHTANRILYTAHNNTYNTTLFMLIAQPS